VLRAEFVHLIATESLPDKQFLCTWIQSLNLTCRS